MNDERTHKRFALLVLMLLIGSVIACSGPEDGRPTQTQSRGSAGTPDVAATTPAPQGDSNTPTGGNPPTDATGIPDDPGAPTPAVTLDPTPTSAEGGSPAPTASPTGTASPSPMASPTVQVVTGDRLLPDHRIVSYYGHPNSVNMGILGEYEKEEVLRLLREQAAEWEAADPSRPTILAFELIATVAQPWPGDDGTYVAYTGDEIIGEFVDFVEANDMILILDLQIGHDTVPNQINLIRHWLEHPRVHVALDPEFSMKANEIVPVDRIPGEFIGETDGRDVQIAMEMLAEIVAEKQIPWKILIVHQFEEDMLYNKDQIRPIPGVQFVLDMDGFGSPEAKLANYNHFVRDELVEYGGIKMFYGQDDPVLTPPELVDLDPPPVVIIYQ